MNILVVGHTCSSEFIFKILSGKNKVYLDNTFNMESLIDKKIDMCITTNINAQSDIEIQSLHKTNIPILLPSIEMSVLEKSKVYTKLLFTKLNIPTQKYLICDLNTDFSKIPKPFVIKTDEFLWGLQTTVITDSNFENIQKFIQSQIVKNKQILVEEFVKIKREYSFHALCNEKSWTYIGSARDYKKRYDNDIGFNTIGMGSYSIIDDVDVNRIGKYIDILLAHLKNYIGFLYLGVIITEDDELLISEINTRPGDPEIQSILPTIDNDLVDLLYKTVTNENLPKVDFNNKNAVTIRLVQKNYSFSEKNIKPAIFNNVPQDINICHMSKCFPNNIITYATLTAVKNTRKEASDYLYDYLKTVDMGDYVVRNDIGYLN
jgi:phosphoribosylamine--glycine ligase